VRMSGYAPAQLARIKCIFIKTRLQKRFIRSFKVFKVVRRVFVLRIFCGNLGSYTWKFSVKLVLEYSKEDIQCEYMCFLKSILEKKCVLSKFFLYI